SSRRLDVHRLVNLLYTQYLRKEKDMTPPITTEELLQLLPRNARRGSKPRCHLLTHGPADVVAAQLTKLAAPFATVTAEDHWMPRGFDDHREAQLHETTKLLSPSVAEQLKRWWLLPASERGMTPNSDIASTRASRSGRADGDDLLGAASHARQEAIALDAAVDDHVRDVDALRPELARHRLHQQAQAALGGVEGGEPRPAAQRARGTGEDHRAAADGRQAAHRLAAEQEAGEATDPPGVLEVLHRHLAEVDGGVVAHVEDEQVGRPAVVVVGHCRIEQADHLVLPGAVDREGRRCPALLADRVDHRLDLLRRAAGDQHVVALFRKAAAGSADDATQRADAEHDGLGFLRHGKILTEQIVPPNLRLALSPRYGPAA